MSHSEEIDRAIGAHGLWKQRLSNAIENGSSEFTVAKLEPDNMCDFGKWYYSLPADIRKSAVGVKVQSLHADFHREAARILSLALKGQKGEAKKLMEVGSKYATVSGQLTITLIDWKKAI